jgi:hypothetical protein
VLYIVGVEMKCTMSVGRGSEVCESSEQGAADEAEVRGPFPATVSCTKTTFHCSFYPSPTPLTWMSWSLRSPCPSESACLMRCKGARVASASASWDRLTIWELQRRKKGVIYKSRTHEINHTI